MVSDNDPELRSSLSLNTSSVYDWDIDRFNHVSSWFRLKKVVAICLAYRKVLRARVAKDRLSQLYPVDSITADDLLYAEMDQDRDNFDVKKHFLLHNVDLKNSQVITFVQLDS